MEKSVGKKSGATVPLSLPKQKSAALREMYTKYPNVCQDTMGQAPKLLDNLEKYKMLLLPLGQTNHSNSIF
jgi:hypothetical protein